MRTGKLGTRSGSPQMFENTINYRPEYILNEDGKRERFKVNRKGEYLLRTEALTIRQTASA